MKTGLLVLGNQLFNPHLLHGKKIDRVFMREDAELCTYEKFHKLKIVFFLSAMRSYADELTAAGLQVDYVRLSAQPDSTEFSVALTEWLRLHGIEKLFMYEIEDKFFETRILAAVTEAGVAVEVLLSPMFLTSREQFRAFMGTNRKRHLMRIFYEFQRKRLSILIDKKGRPEGGAWSFDDQNRLPLPKGVEPPKLRAAAPTVHTRDVVNVVDKRFATHPGGTANIWFSTTRKNAELMLDRFLEERYANFGAYEDALTTRSVFVFHSALSPYLNTGLLTPDHVVERALEIGRKQKINLASVEGFIRQIIGWREFMRGIYQEYDEQQRSTNFWNHHRQLSNRWYEGGTEIPPLDDAITKVRKFAYAHHIERLMVVGNLMLLLEIAPAAAHRWFMEMFIDSSDWVMGPNVYGMGIFSDGGNYATKPYICGSNYYRKMGEYKKGDWCDGVDGLYWSFVEKHAEYFAKNPRSSFAVRTLEKMDSGRKRDIYAAAELVRGKLTV